MILRIALALVALFLALNGLNMLFAPAEWYASIPSVAHTGPLNPHFIRDIGIAYLASAISLALAVWRLNYFWPGTIGALAFVGLHAVLHLWETAIGSPASHAMGPIDIVGVYGPPLLIILIIAWFLYRPVRES